MRGGLLEVSGGCQGIITGLGTVYVDTRAVVRKQNRMCVWIILVMWKVCTFLTNV